MVYFVYPAPGQSVHAVQMWCLQAWALRNPCGMRPAIWNFPESRVHPPTRHLIADKAVKRSPGRDFFVITHSDQTVLRLQALSAQKALFTILVFSDTRDAPTEIPLEDDGRFIQEWPPSTNFWGHRMDLLTGSVHR